MSKGNRLSPKKLTTLSKRIAAVFMALTLVVGLATFTLYAEASDDEFGLLLFNIEEAKQQNGHEYPNEYGDILMHAANETYGDAGIDPVGDGPIIQPVPLSPPTLEVIVTGLPPADQPPPLQLDFNLNGTHPPISIPARPGFTMTHWSLEFDLGGSVDHRPPVAPQLTGSRTSLSRTAGADYYTAIVTIPSDIIPLSVTLTANFAPIQIGLANLDLNDNGRRAFVGYSSIVHDSDAEITNLLQDVLGMYFPPVFPLILAQHPAIQPLTLEILSSTTTTGNVDFRFAADNSTVFTIDSTIIPSTTIPAVLNSHDVIQVPAGVIQGGGTANIPIIPNAGVPIGEHQAQVRVTQVITSLGSATLGYFYINFKVEGPITNVNILDPRSANGNVVLTVPSLTNGSPGATPATISSGFTSTAVQDDPSDPYSNITITISRPQSTSNPAQYQNTTHFNIGNYNFINDATVTNGVVSNIQVPAGYTVATRSYANGVLTIVLTPDPATIYNTITFNLAGGNINNSTVNPTVQRPQGGTVGSAAIPATDPLRAGYTFAGWALVPGQPMGPQDFDDTLVTGDITFIAQWTQNYVPTPTNHTITFNLNGGNINGNTVNPTVQRQQNTTIGPGATPANPTRPGFTFAGWAHNGQPISAAQIEAMTVTGNITFTALWTQNVVPTPTPSPTPPMGGIITPPTPSPTPSPTPEPTQTPTPTPPAPVRLIRPNIFVGFEDGTLRPQSSVTRAQAVTIIYRLMDYHVRENYSTSTNPFPDVPNNVWHNSAISTIYNVGLISGFPDGTFRPDEYITAAELITLLAQFAELAPLSGEPAFEDVTAAHWAAERINAAIAAGWLDGGGNLNPNAPISRARTANIVNRMLSRNPANISDFYDVIRYFPDNQDPNAWYYYDMIIVTNAMYVLITEDGREYWLEIITDADWREMSRRNAGLWQYLMGNN